MESGNSRGAASPDLSRAGRDAANESTPLLRGSPGSLSGQSTPTAPLPIGRPANRDGSDANEFDLLLSRSVPSGGPMLEPEPLEYSMLRRPRRYSHDSSTPRRSFASSHDDCTRVPGSSEALSDEERLINPKRRVGDGRRDSVTASDANTGGNAPLTSPKGPYLGGVSVSRFWLIFSGILATNFIACFDGTIMASSHPVITSYFNSSNSASWLSTAFLLTSTSFQPLLGRLSDTLGRKPPYLVTMTIFLLATVWCGLAQSMTSFILARAACGLGAGGMMTLGSIIISDLVPIE